MQRAKTGHVPEDNAVGLQVALEQAMLDETPPILRRVETVLAGPEHAGLRKAFAAWRRWATRSSIALYAKTVHIFPVCKCRSQGNGRIGECEARADAFAP